MVSSFCRRERPACEHRTLKLGLLNAELLPLLRRAAPTLGAAVADQSHKRMERRLERGFYEQNNHRWDRLYTTKFAFGLHHWSSQDGTPGQDDYDNEPNAAFVPADQDFSGCLELTRTQAVQKLRDDVTSWFSFLVIKPYGPGHFRAWADDDWQCLSVD